MEALIVLRGEQLLLGATEDFIEGLKALMAERGWTVVTMNNETGVSRSYLNDLLNHRKKPSLEFADKLLLKAFGVSLGAVLSKKPLAPPTVPSEFEPVYRKLPAAIRSAAATGTEESFRYALMSLIENAIDKQAEVARALKRKKPEKEPIDSAGDRASPLPDEGEGEGNRVGAVKRAAGRRRK